MTTRPNVVRWIVLTGLLALPRLAAAEDYPEPTAARIHEIVRVAAQKLAAPRTASQTPAPGDSQPFAPERAVVKLTLDDAVKLALDRNLDIAVQRLTPQTFDFSLASLRAAYMPSVSSVFLAQSISNPANSTVAAGSAAAGASITTTTGNLNGALGQNLPWGGGGVALTLNNARTTTTSTTTLYKIYYNPQWTAQYTQPLLRGFSTDSTRQQLVVTRLNQDISEVQLKSTIVNTLSNVRNAYWDYVYAVQAVEVAGQSVALANQLVADNQARLEVGTMAPIEVVQARSQLASAQQVLVAAQATVRTSELALKRLIVNGTEDPNWNVRLDPIDRPEFAPTAVDVEAAVRRALGERTDLQIARKNLQANSTTLKFLRNQVLPQADVVASYRLAGAGGTKYDTTGSGLTRAITGTIPGTFGDSLNSLFGADYPAWTISLNFSYPLGMSTADAAVARARVQVNQTTAQINQIELQIATDVTNAALQVQSNAQTVQAAHAATILAEQTLDAERSKFEVGMSTNFTVIQFQRDLATAENTELQAILNYRKSLVEFDRLQQTTLSSLGITVLTTGGLNNTAVGSGRPTVVAGGS